MSLSVLQLHGCSGRISSPFWGRGVCSASSSARLKVRLSGNGNVRIYAMSSNGNSSSKMNLNEYMVTLEKPLGIRFALSTDGKIFVHSLKKGGNAERSRIVMVGDTLKKASDASSGGKLIAVTDSIDTQELLAQESGSFSLVLERPFSPFPIHQLHNIRDALEMVFNRGRVSVATWNRNALASNLKSSLGEGNGNSGFVTFSPKFLTTQGWKLLSAPNVYNNQWATKKNSIAPSVSQLVSVFGEEESGDGEWGHGNFPLDEYVKALERAEGELYYNHAQGMRYSKITEQMYVGSCIQNEADVANLSSAVSASIT